MTARGQEASRMLQEERVRHLEAYTLVVVELSDEVFLWQCYLPNEGNLKTTVSERRVIINTNRKKNDKLHKELDCKLKMWRDLSRQAFCRITPL